jgi:hypothetical protein
MEDVDIVWPFLSILGPHGIFMAFWYIFWSFGKFFTVLVCCAEKNLATLEGEKNFPVLLTEYLLRLFASRENTAATGGKQSNVDKVASILLISLHISFFSLKLPPYTLAGFELTTNKFPSGDETTMQTTRAL